MAGRVFVSCGQRDPEREVVLKIKKLLEEEFQLSAYLAFRIQSLNDIMTITQELKSSDYYLFVDFQRKPGNTSDLQVSMFTHQELALAHHLGFKDNMIALQQKGCPREGFLAYVLSNPETFTDESDLLTKIQRLLTERNWSNSYSRNLVLSELNVTGPWRYSDGNESHLEHICTIRVDNRRPDSAAVGSVCILDYILPPNGNGFKSPDRSYLKWAQQSGYERTILPKDFGRVDLFSIRAERSGLFLHSSYDLPREPIAQADGHYILYYKLYSQGFPLLEFSVAIDFSWSGPQQLNWPCTSAVILEPVL